MTSRQHNELKAWEMQCKLAFDIAQDAYRLARVEDALYALLAKDEASGYTLGQTAWDALYNEFGYVECLEAADRLVAKGRCGMNDGALYTLLV